MEAEADRSRTWTGVWVLLLLILLGLVPFFVSALVARTARTKALTDPKARKLLTDDEPDRVTGQ